MLTEADRRTPPARWSPLPEIPVRRYTDAHLFELEREHVFRRSWLYACHESELPKAGSFVVFDRTGSPMVVVRGTDGEVRAFYNSCRHRNAPVVKELCGTARRLVCQFHSWSYDTRGALVAVPDEDGFAGLDRSNRGLVPVRCEQWLGFVFVNEDPSAQPLSDFLGRVPEELDSEYAGQPLRVVYRRGLTLNCNWKVVVEAFLEVYHLRTVHPTTVGRMLDHRATSIGLLPNGHSRMSTKSRVEAGGKAGHDGLPAMPTVGPLLHETSTSYLLFPNLVTPLGHAGLPFLLAWPQDVTTTFYEWVYFGLDWGDGPVPEAWSKRMALFDTIMDEDMVNMEPIQRSLMSRGARDIPLSYQERRLWHFNAFVDRAIGVERVPPDLAVAPLSDDLIEAHAVEREGQPT